MTEAELDLARRLVAHPRWKWMPGMLAGDGRRITLVENGKVWADDCYYDATDAEWREQPLTVPDLSDPATIGCIGALIDRELEGKPARRWPRSPERLDTKGARRAWFLLLLWGERVR